MYTGNISEWSTTMGTQAMNTYGFEYDKLGRLKNTLHYSAAATTPTAAYTERGITYDLNGNITTLKRYAASEATPEDDYQYIYTGNKLMQITGTENNADISNALYVYDQNGNIIFDGLKNLQISYNFLKLPSVVSQSSAEIAKYGWFADGSKYSVLDNSNNGYCYIGSLIYASNNGNLQIESTDFAGGRINLAQTGSSASGTNNTCSTLTQDIHYFHTDHLGSVRAITNDNGETVEQNAYYPFGSRHTFGNTYAQTTNRFKFNGKEEQTAGNLNYLDYGARMYDSNIGRWTTQDPLAEQMYGITPYRFSLNNPTNIIDIFGLSDYFDFNGQYLGSDGSDKDLIRIITQENWEKMQIKNDDGSVIYNSEIGMELSIAFSDANLDKDATLNIYNNYNITGLELIERKDDSNLNKAAGMTFTLRLCKQLNQIIPYIKIPINKNKDAKFIDNANNIINSFVHENEHLKDYKRLGLKGYQSMPEHEREQRAISKQVNHPSFINTTPQYKKAIYKYYQRMHQ